MHARIAALLGWTLAEVQSFSLPMLREIVRGVRPSIEREELLEELSRRCAPGAAIKDPAVIAASRLNREALREAARNGAELGECDEETFETCRHDFPVNVCPLCP